jgi:hypothetical protein
MTKPLPAQEFTYVAKTVVDVARACNATTENVTIAVNDGNIKRRKRGKANSYEYDLVSCVAYFATLRAERKAKRERNKLEKHIEELKLRLESKNGSLPLADATSTELKDELVRVQIQERKLEHARKMKLLCSWQNMESFFEFFAAQIRRAGELLRKHHGPDAQALFDEALTVAEREWVSLSDRLHREEHGELTPGGRVSKRPAKNGSPRK